MASPVEYFFILMLFFGSEDPHPHGIIMRDPTSAERKTVFRTLSECNDAIKTLPDLKSKTRDYGCISYIDVENRIKLQ